MEEQNKTITNTDNILDFITQADRAERMIQLKNDVMQSLQVIRKLKADLEDETEHLKRLLKTNIQEDTELTDLMKGIL
jgi:hypothetical protein